MPYISVVLPTMRVGGLDVVFAGLAQQSFTDFELVIADGLYHWRAAEVAELAKKYKFRVKHVEPIGNPFPVIGFCRYSNTTLVHASGAIVLFITDYTWMPPDCLQTHAKFHSDNSTKMGLMCPHKYTVLPPLNLDFPTYTHAGIKRYASDINEGKLDNCRISIFKEFFALNPAEMEVDPIFGNCDPKLAHPAGKIGSQYLHGKNESCRLQAVIDINGWDEDLDGTNCYQDSDLSDRLSIKAGIEWMCDPKNVVYIVNPRNFFPRPIWHRPIASNERIWQYKKLHGYDLPVNSWNLAEVRDQMRNL